MLQARRDCKVRFHWRALIEDVRISRADRHHLPWCEDSTTKSR
jgi:hypothetical protein